MSDENVNIFYENVDDGVGENGDDGNVFFFCRPVIVSEAKSIYVYKERIIKLPCIVDQIPGLTALIKTSKSSFRTLRLRERFQKRIQ